MDGHGLLAELGLPDQFGFLLLAISLILLLAPYLSGSDLGVLKIPQVTDAARRTLRALGPIAIAAAILLHVPFFPKNGPRPSADPVPGPGSGPAASASTSPCRISGTVFDSDNDQPLSAISIGVHRETSFRPEPMRRGVATTGLDGRFGFDCSWIDSSAFPILLSLSHPDWVATRIMNRIDRPGQWEAVNLPVPMSDVDLVPLREVGISFGTKDRTSEHHIVGGVIENDSARAYSCVRFTFQLVRTVDGNRMNAGTQVVEARNLLPAEKRPYEQAFPLDAGFHLRSKSEC